MKKFKSVDDLINQLKPFDINFHLNERVDEVKQEKDNWFVKTELLPKMQKVYPKSEIRKEVIGEIIGFNREKNSEACELVSSITGDNSREVVSFGTEAGLFQEIGISTVVCGPGSVEQAHTIDEFVSYEQLKKCLALLIQINDFAKK